MRSRPRGATFTACLLWPELIVLLLLSQINTTLVAWNKGNPQFWGPCSEQVFQTPNEQSARLRVIRWLQLIFPTSLSSRSVLHPWSSWPFRGGIFRFPQLCSLASVFCSYKKLWFAGRLQTVPDNFIFKTNWVMNLILPAAFIISCHGAYAFLDSEDWDWNLGRP